MQHVDLLQEEVLEDLAVRYLASIPARQEPAPRARSAVTPLPFSFPDEPRVVTVRCAAAQPGPWSWLCWPASERSGL